MAIRQRILLTGVTGAVGSSIAAEALNRGHSILALMRDDNRKYAEERLNNALNTGGAEDFVNSVDVMKGDICKDLLSVADGNETGDLTMIVHCAASTEFSESNIDQSFETNVQGTKNVLEVAAKLNVPLCYISTAYIAGRRHGIVMEDETYVGQKFNNIYEQTKCEAEGLVHKWTQETGLPVFVFRPSIVIGDSKSGRIATFNGIYNIVRFFDTVGPIIGNEEIRVVGKADVTKNLIPVDHLAQAVWHIIERGIAGTYHITNPSPLSLGELRDIYANLFGLNAKLVTEEEFQSKKPTRIELLYRKASSLYAPYMAAEPIFDRKNTDTVLKNTNVSLPVIDTEYFDRLLRYAKSVQWGKSQSRPAHLSRRASAMIEEYFDDFLAKKMHKQLLPDLKKLSAKFRIILKEEPNMYWSLAIERGALVSVSRNGLAYECSFIVDRSTFADITSGQVGPQQAFFKKRVDIEGNIETGLKLVAVLAAFFKKYPYRMEACLE